MAEGENQPSSASYCRHRTIAQITIRSTRQSEWTPRGKRATCATGEAPKGPFLLRGLSRGSHLDESFPRIADRRHQLVKSSWVDSTRFGLDLEATDESGGLHYPAGPDNWTNDRTLGDLGNHRPLLPTSTILSPRRIRQRSTSSRFWLTSESCQFGSRARRRSTGHNR